MHIEQLRVDGFKSFGEPTVVPFYEGFTTISGPNGSGKSNLIDSILFALGLARTRGMRARKLPDLLYDPPEGGDSVNEASVEVVLDNSERTVTEEEIRSACGECKDPDEVVVKRRIKRTSNDYYSYYYLNGRSVNLSDVQDLLENAGVTPEGYNVVMQGDVTEIINMSPTERRGIIEQTAGTAKFDEKKEQALEELEVVEERVERVELILEEIEERLEELEEERNKALEYKELKQEKEEYESYLVAAKLQDVEDEIEGVEQKIEAERDEKERLEDELDERNDELESLKDELAELNDEISRKGEDERLELKSELEEIKGRISTNEDRIEDARGTLDELENKRREAFVAADKAREELEDIEDEIRDTKVRKSSLKSDLASKESELEDVQDEIEEVEGEYADVRKELQDEKERADELRDEKNELQREKDRLLDDARRRSREVEEAEDALEEARSSLEEAEREEQDLRDKLGKERKNLEQLQEVRDDLRDERDELKDDLDDIEESLRAKQEEYAEAEARSGGGGSSYGRAVSAALNADIDGVHGTVADLGSVSSEYATACETAAGGRMANVVVDDDSVGQRCIEHLKRRNAGRATFLPLNEMHDRSLSSRPLSRDGVVDYAYNLVEFDPRYSGVFSYVFGDTLVVEDIETARDMMGDYRMVTLDGDLVEKSGAMTGGSKRESRYSFGSKGAVQRLADRIEELEDERRSVKNDLADVEGRLEEVNEDFRDKRDEVDRYEDRLDDIEDEKESLNETIDEKETRLEEAEEQRAETRDEMEEVEERINELQEEIDDAEERVDELREELEGSRISELTDRADEIRDGIDALEDDVRDVDGELNELQLEKGYKEDAIEEHQEKIQEIDEKRDEKEALTEELEDEIGALEDEADEKRAEIEEIDEEIGELREERDAKQDEVEEKADERDEVRRKVERADDRIDSLRARLSSLEDEADELREELDETLDDVPDYDDLKDEIERVEDEMEELEPVNMLAIEEYDDVKERQDDLQDRKATLEDEKGGINERIEGFEKQKREKFTEAFEAIDEQFREVFERLSDGTGELVLDDPDAPFESGLTIEAKPRDKPVKRLEQMSGGERSLTALSLIFAIQRYTPAPFYAFDEVDESLDAVNVEKVAETIDEIADATQFVVISHRSNMVEKADRIVGVTMQDDNVSRVTGVKVNDGGDKSADATAD